MSKVKEISMEEISLQSSLYSQQRSAKNLTETNPNKRFQRRPPRRICCFEIKQQWSIKKQLFISILVLSSIIFTFVIAIVFVNLFITKELLMNAQKNAIKSQVEKNLQTQASVYALSIFQDILSQAQNLDLFNKIILAALQEDNTLYDFKLSKAFPVYGPGYGLNVFQSIPLSLVTQDSVLQSSYINPVTLKTWNYGAFLSSDQISLSIRGQQLYNATDVLNHILEDFYYNRKITFIDLIYVNFIENGLTMFYPGGAVRFNTSTNYNPQNTTWFQAVNYTLNVLGVFGGAYKYDPICSTHIDQTTLERVLTISLPIINNQNVFLGCSNINMQTKDLQKFFKIQNQPLNTYIYMTNSYGEVLNKPYDDNPQALKLNQTYITNITDVSWQQINQWAIQQAANLTLTSCTNIFHTKDPQGISVLLVVSLSLQPITRYYILIIIQTPQSVAMQFSDSLGVKITNEFEQTEIKTVITITVTILLAMSIAYFFSFCIVKPLTDLTLYALQINQSITNQRKGLTKKQEKIDLDSIHAQDKIGSLIEAFKNLIQGLAGLKKGNKRDCGSQKLIQFPLNLLSKFEWEDQINLIKDENQFHRINPQNKVEG